MKILGVEFEWYGISNDNVNRMIEKIQKSIGIWSGVYNLNMIERIVTVRTFILSKMWYLANFICFSIQHVKNIESMIHKFIWCNSAERIKRNTLILNYESGGLNNVCLKAKLETILITNFINIIFNKERMFYQYSVKHLKFRLRENFD